MRILRGRVNKGLGGALMFRGENCAGAFGCSYGGQPAIQPTFQFRVSVNHKDP